MKQSGIYRIVNKINGKGYVGSSGDLSHRNTMHFHDLFFNKHENPYLQNAWNKYGEDNFVFKILEIIKNPTKKKLEKREQYWMDKLQSYDDKFGYNIRKIAESNFGIKFGPEPQTIKNKKNILKFIKKFGYRPSSGTGTKRERFLGNALRMYMGKTTFSYDPEFAKIISKYPDKAIKGAEDRKNEILEFCKKYGYRPVYQTDNKYESILGNALSVYLNHNGSAYDLNFEKKINRFPTFTVYKLKKVENEIFKFINKHGYRPTRKSNNKKERQLKMKLAYYISPNSKGYNPILAKKIKKIPYKIKRGNF
jgi:group I intron endonuclease